MKLRERLLAAVAKPELARNRKFRNLHKGESCYIIGNGVSLKSTDLRKLGDRISIGCNWLYLHKDFEALDCRYYQISGPFLFYPYRWYTGSFERNRLASLYRENIERHSRTNFFTSISNKFSTRAKNLYFTHHFGAREWNLDRCDMAGVFSFMGGGLQAMIGTAIYMGFESALLVGCDYTFAPPQALHFFEKGKGLPQEKMPNPYGRLFDAVQSRLDLTTLVESGMKSDVLKYMTYEDYTGSPAHFRENTEIVDKESLVRLDSQGDYRIF